MYKISKNQLNSFVLLILLIVGCAGNQNNQEPDNPKVTLKNTIEKESHEVKNDRKLPFKQSAELKQNVNETPIQINIEYTLDSLSLHRAKIVLVEVIDMKINISHEELFPSVFKKDLEASIENSLLTSLEQFMDEKGDNDFKFKLLEADFNFDGYTDIYFVDENGFAQNTGYYIYLYSKEKKEYIKADDLWWASIKFDEDKGILRAHYHFSASEGGTTEYKVYDDGKIKPVISK